MKFIKNSIMILAVLGIVGLGCSMKVEACMYTPGCYSVIKNIQCGPSMPPMASSTHTSEANGYAEKCIIYTISADHTIRCVGCGYLYTDNERRICSIIHSYRYCPPTYNCCQYQ